MGQKIYTPKGTNATPFNPQLEHFDFICGQVIKENRILKFVVVISCLAFFVSIAITVFAINQPDSIPVLVTMNDFGETRYVGEVSKKNWQGFRVPELAVRHQVKEFINLYHSLSTDRIVARGNIEKIYHLLTVTTAQKYSTLLRENNPLANFGNITRTVEFETEPLQISGNTYQLDYKVTTRTLSGGVTEVQRKRAAVTLDTLQPVEEDLQSNPLGIYITAFDISDLK